MLVLLCYCAFLLEFMTTQLTMQFFLGVQSTCAHANMLMAGPRQDSVSVKNMHQTDTDVEIVSYCVCVSTACTTRG